MSGWESRVAGGNGNEWSECAFYYAPGTGAISMQQWVMSNETPPMGPQAIQAPWRLAYLETVDEKGEGRLQVVKLGTGTLTAESLAYLYADGASFQFISGRPVLYGAGYGYLGRYVGASAKGQPMDFRLFTTIRKGRGYVLICAGPIDKIDNYLLDIEQILRGFKFG